jgi:hypothetical protein
MLISFLACASDAVAHAPAWADPAMLFSANPNPSNKTPSSGYCFTCLPSVPALSCNYSIMSQAAEVWNGRVPDWLNGTFYKTFSFLNVTDGSKLATMGDIGAIGNVQFTAGSNAPPRASLGLVRGTDWQSFCGPGGGPANYSSSGVVTVNSACGPGRVCPVLVMPEMPAMDATTLATVESPHACTGSLGNKQTPVYMPAPYAPSYFMGAHMPADSNGDAYGGAA